jgi:glycosyltransferase involved in cell wall biosynthesis
LKAAKRSGATVLMTWHAPGQSCARWDLLYKNRDMCPGQIDAFRCTDCALHRIGIPAPARTVLARLDLSPLARFLPYDMQHPFVRRRGLEHYQHRWAEGMAIPDKILWHAEWVRDLLLRNGITSERLHYVPLPPIPPQPVTPAAGARSNLRRFVYIGRLADIKGPHIISQAAQHIPRSDNFEILFVGAKGPDDYLRRIERECAADPRLRLMPPISFDAIPAFMRDSDAVIVPSLWPETGPYTVLEALWTGTPVVGSDRAGIRELLSKWGGGVLFPPGDARQLAKLIMESDFRAMRRDPGSLQAMWRAGFDQELDALCNDIRTSPRALV